MVKINLKTINFIRYNEYKFWFEIYDTLHEKYYLFSENLMTNVRMEKWK
jgi:hypothetical protein